MDLSQDIFETISFAIDKIMQPYRNQDVMASIKNIQSGKYIVQINGKEYALYDGVGLSLKIGDSVWVHKPNGNIHEAYICAKVNK